MKTIYFIVREFNEGTGSYSGFVEEFCKYLHKNNQKAIILCVNKNNQKAIETLPYAEIYRFSIPNVRVPFLGMNLDYLLLGNKVKKFFSKRNEEEKIIVVNGRAGLGVLDKNYVLRTNHPSTIFSKNMLLAKPSLKTKIASKIHLMIQQMIEKKCVKNASSFIFSSLVSKDYNFNKYNNIKPFFVPQSGVDYSYFSEGPVNLDNQRILVVSSGTDKVRKGIDCVEKAIKGVLIKNKGLKLIHVGDKTDWDIPKENLECVGRVEWKRTKDYYKSSSMIILAGLTEGIPNVLVEAMSSGCPIITSDIDGITEFIKHKESGYIFKRGDVKELEKAIVYMLEHGEEAKEMANKAQEFIKRFDYPTYYSSLLDFLNKNNGRTQ